MIWTGERQYTYNHRVTPLEAIREGKVPNSFERRTATLGVGPIRDLPQVRLVRP
jgi:hypothetical protein